MKFLFVFLIEPIQRKQYRQFFLSSRCKAIPIIRSVSHSIDEIEIGFTSHRHGKAIVISYIVKVIAG